FLATGESLSSLHFQYQLGISTLSGIVADTCRALWNVLRDEFMPLPTVDMWLEVAEKFWSLQKFFKQTCLMGKKWLGRPCNFQNQRGKAGDWGPMFIAWEGVVTWISYNPCDLLSLSSSQTNDGFGQRNLRKRLEKPNRNILKK
ncbi:unnamed protein product, partial [Ranitomeya imitator]